MTKQLFPVLAALVLALPGAAHAQVKVGFINSMTGAEAPIGENLTNGVDLAVEDLAKQGIEVRLVKRDDTGKPEAARAAMEQLARDGVVAVVGPYTSANASAVATLAQQHGVPQVIPVAAKEELTRLGHDFVFRVNAPAQSYARSLLDAATSLGSPRTIAFVYESTDFGASVAAAGKAYAARKGIEVVGDEPYKKGAFDFRPTLARIKAASPDLVFMVSYVADAILLMRQAREVGLRPQAFLGAGGGFDTAQFEGERDISTHVFSVTQWTPDMGTPGATEFAKRYRTRYGKKPTYHAACAYAAMMVAGEAAAAAGGDRAKVKAALESGAWTGILGEVRFEDFDGFTNQNRHEMPVVQYQGGRSETVFPAKLARKQAVYPFPGWK